jgi:glyoxylase-like metal-dependent hydrolase (beta-lactamase superfamily II)
MPAEVAGFVHDRPDAVAPGVVRVTAANPGMMTGPGTNTYLLGTDELAVIDPGPDDAAHLDAVAAAGAGAIRWIFVTHTHPDHAPGAAGLAERTGAERLGFASRDGFDADRTVGDGFELHRPGLRIRAVHTPGHASNHLCYLAELPEVLGPGKGSTMLFSGDHVMDRSTVVISPPDGDMSVYLASLTLLLRLEPPVDVIAPGHGNLIEDPAGAVDAYVAHRLEREELVAKALAAAGSATVDELIPVVYADVDEARHPVARRSLWAHLRKLADDGRARSSDRYDPGATWEWPGPQPD